MGYDQYGNYVPDNNPIADYLMQWNQGSGQEASPLSQYLSPSYQPSGVSNVPPPMSANGMVDPATMNALTQRISSLNEQANGLLNQKYDYPDVDAMRANLRDYPSMPSFDIRGQEQGRGKGSLIAGGIAALLGGGLAGAGAAAGGFGQGYQGSADRMNQSEMAKYQNQLQAAQQHNAIIRQQFADKLGQTDRKRGRDLETASTLQKQLGSENNLLGKYQGINERAARGQAANAIRQGESQIRAVNQLLKMDPASQVTTLKGMTPEALQQKYGFTPELADEIIRNPLVQSARPLPPDVIAKLRAATDNLKERTRGMMIDNGYKDEEAQAKIDALEALTEQRKAGTAFTIGPKTEQTKAQTGLIGAKTTGQAIANRYAPAMTQSKINNLNAAIENVRSQIKDRDYKRQLAVANANFARDRNENGYMMSIEKIKNGIDEKLNKARTTYKLLNPKATTEEISKAMADLQEEASAQKAHLNEIKFKRSNASIPPAMPGTTAPVPKVDPKKMSDAEFKRYFGQKLLEKFGGK